jgi:hypothetical protein
LRYAETQTFECSTFSGKSKFLDVSVGIGLKTVLKIIDNEIKALGN